MVIARAVCTSDPAEASYNRSYSRYKNGNFSLVVRQHDTEAMSMRKELNGTCNIVLHNMPHLEELYQIF